MTSGPLTHEPLFKAATRPYLRQHAPGPVKVGLALPHIDSRRAMAFAKIGLGGIGITRIQDSEVSQPLLEIHHKVPQERPTLPDPLAYNCLLYTSDAADE